MKNMVYIQSGGPTSVINTSLYGAIKEAKRHEIQYQVAEREMFAAPGTEHRKKYVGLSEPGITRAYNAMRESEGRNRIGFNDNIEDDFTIYTMHNYKGTKDQNNQLFNAYQKGKDGYMLIGAHGIGDNLEIKAIKKSTAKKINDYKGNLGKLEQCMDIITDSIEANHRILLFSSYTAMFEIIEKELEKRNIEYFKLTGSTKVDTRIEMVEKFNKDENIKVFLISLKAGGTGLNLTGADVVIYFDPWWNLSSENQATDRAYRIGQKNSVQVYKMITTNTIEEKINKLQEKKASLSEQILSTEEKFINKLSKEELMGLFDME